MSERGRRIFDASAEAENAEQAPATEAAEPVVPLATQGGQGALPVGEVAADAAAANAPAVTPPIPAPVLPGWQGAVPVPQPLARGHGTLARFQAAGSAVLAEGTWRLRRLGTSGLVGIGLLVGACVLFMANTLPQGQAISALKAQLARLGPLAQGGAGGPQVQVALSGLPGRDDAPDVLDRIYQEAQAAGVELPRGNYEFIAARDGIAAHYRMTFPVHTGYPQLRAFMDHTLIALPSVAVEGLRIERKNVSDATVDAELKLAAFVRDGS